MTAAAPWIEALSTTAPAERRGVLECCVADAFRIWLHMTAADALPLDESYFALGLSSLGAVELQQYLEARLERRIDSANLYNHPTIAHLVAYLCREVLTDLFPPEAPASVAEDPIGNASRRLFNDLLSDLYEA